MKEQIKHIISETTNKLLARSRVREYCQARILQFLQESGVFRSCIFHGGTALRFLYMLPRYSEDLDFALENSSSTLNFGGVIANVCKSFEAEAYRIDSKINDRTAVKSAFIRFPELPHDLGLSPHRSEMLSVKVEVDSNPPAGGITETSVIRRYVMLNLFHYDKASLLSGKLHAILARPYVKGRDLYDLFWYLSDPSWPEPNIRFLTQALFQTNWKGPEITESNWTILVAKKLEDINWDKAVEDTRPFIEKPSDLKLLTKEKVFNTLKSRKF
ncbi:MAG: nucleotidyl transferase AbiEii/AbiGii toxin family protein [Candidatus Aminicenantes bacterium]|nr:nucleotidyl transferase AbiEii/AbiGii toxin family protein [Candidatus Aminicenantes bacterium]